MRNVLIVLWSVFFVACSQYPKDAEDSLKRIEGGVLKVGISHHPPFTVITDTSYGGTEVTMVKAYAAYRQAQILWTESTETHMAEMLKNFQLDIMISGLVEDSPIVEGLGTTQPYFKDSTGKHIIAVAPGENALLTDLDGFLVKYKQ